MKLGADRGLPKPRPRTRLIAVRFYETTLRRVEDLAARQGVGYQTLLKESVMERLYEEEMRVGMVGGWPAWRAFGR